MIKSFTVFCSIIVMLGCLGYALAQSSATVRPEVVGGNRYNNPYYNDFYYNDRYSNGRYYHNRYYQPRDYYFNRDYYNTARNYENYFKRYNPQVAAAKAQIFEQENETNEGGVYRFRYDTENGIHAEERAVNTQTNNEDAKKSVEGMYSFVTPEGVRVIVKYTADENGFHPTITYDTRNSEHVAALPRSADVTVNQLNSVKKL